ncbi:MAG: helix-turn-helix domain-containing protein [Proteobacteria bacterium]|nr:helix-turn-helix domain-containing protein [Pseudomonadota bacterium]
MASQQPNLIKESEAVKKKASAIVGPGSRLRIARERAQLNIEDVANYLHLNPEIITALEQDDYSHTSNFVFIRGYLRSYAKMVSLSGDEIVGLFNQLALEEQPSDRPVYSIDRKQISVKDRPFRWVTYFILLTIVTLFGIWWYASKTDLTSKKESAVESTAVTQPTTVAQPAQTETDKTATKDSSNVEILTPAEQSVLDTSSENQIIAIGADGEKANNTNTDDADATTQKASKKSQTQQKKKSN